MTDFEQTLLRIVRAQRGEGYGVTIRLEAEATLNRMVSYGELYTTLDELERGGYVESRDGEATAERGYRKKKHYRVTESGGKVLAEALQQAEGEPDPAPVGFAPATT